MEKAPFQNENGKITTVTVDRNEYTLTKDAFDVFKNIRDEWELEICEYNNI